MSANAGTSSPGTIDVSAIERELVRLLDAPENRSADGQPASRTAVVNLVAFASNHREMERITSTLATLAAHHPSRTIVVEIDPEAPAGTLEASVQVQCKPLGTAGLKVCNEQVIIQTNPGSLRRVPNVVLPLLIADLPEIIWWPGEPPVRDPFLLDLLERAHRLIVDSAEFVHVERTLTALNTLQSRPGWSLDLTDLNWGRLRPWRELIAHFWDVPSRRSHLRRLGHIEIDIGRPEGGRSNRQQALLLIGWLASRLGWQAQGIERLKDGYRMYLLAGRRPLNVRVRISPDPQRGIRAVRFVVDDARGPGAYSIVAGARDTAVTSMPAFGRHEVITRGRRLETYSEPELLAADLDAAHGDLIFEAALDSAVSFLRAR